MKASLRDQLVLFLAAVGVNSLLAIFVTSPGYMDAAYYYGGALRLVRGHGFTEPYLWNYLSGLTSLPVPSHLYWMPLTSMLAAIGMLLFGSTFRAAQIPFVILSSLVPVFTYQMGMLTLRWRRIAFTAGVFAIFSGFYVKYWANTDAFALFALAGGLALMMMAYGYKQGNARWFALSGALIGLAHLARADGVLFLPVAFYGVWISSKGTQNAHPGWVRHLSLFLRVCAGYLLVMSPWFIRNVRIFGTPFAPGGLQTLWLTEYNDLFNFPSNLTLQRYLSQGLIPILSDKAWALGQNLQTFVAVQGLVFLAPFILIGLVRLRHQEIFRLVSLYAILLYLSMTLIFTFPGVRGGLLHSSAALLPFFMVAGVYGLQHAIAWTAARRQSWDLNSAQKTFTGSAVILAVALSGFVAYSGVIAADESNMERLYAEIGGTLQKNAVVASNDPPGFYVASGHAGVFVPNGDPESLRAVIEQFEVDYVVLDQNHPPGLAEVYSGKLDLPWLCSKGKVEGGVTLFAAGTCE